MKPVFIWYPFSSKVTYSASLLKDMHLFLLNSNLAVSSGGLVNCFLFLESKSCSKNN